MRDGIILVLAIIVLIMALLGSDHAGPAGLIEDVSAAVHQSAPQRTAMHGVGSVGAGSIQADWQACQTIGNAPLTVPPPAGEVRKNYRRDTGVA